MASVNACSGRERVMMMMWGVEAGSKQDGGRALCSSIDDRHSLLIQNIYWLNSSFSK